jgi:hypothetical protein
LGSLVQPAQAMLLGWYVNKSKKEQEIATEKEESNIKQSTSLADFFRG